MANSNRAKMFFLGFMFLVMNSSFSDAANHFTRNGRAVPPEVRYCQAASSPSHLGDDNFSFFSVNDGQAAFCKFGVGAIGYQTLFNRTQNNIVSLAIKNYEDNSNCRAGGKCFVCNEASNCRIQSGEFIDFNGVKLGQFDYYVFVDGSSIGKNCMDLGPLNPLNAEMNQALGKKNINY